MDEIVGRKYEKGLLTEVLDTNESEFIVLIGRRRIGKTYLVRKLYANRINFDMVGLQNGSLSDQLQIFSTQLTHYAKSNIPIEKPKNWLEAFEQLTLYLNNLKIKKKKVLFFDEFPWISTHKSGFVEAFAHFWNSWAAISNVVIVVCGSSSSWMINKIINAKGGLHNRTTRLIELQPFSLSETEQYLKSRKIELDRYQIVQLYMAMGGVPHYLKEIKPGLSATQNIDDICFNKTGILNNEYKNLYAALFENAEKHIKVIEILAKKWKGYTRNEIIEVSDFSNGGALSTTLRELEASSFITSYAPFNNKKRETLYRLTDQYSLFYLKFIKPNTSSKKGTWQQLSQKQTWKSWSGFAFESVCLYHISKIIEHLGISGIYTREGSYVSKGTSAQDGFQIDLLIDRDDKCINLCEMKFYDNEYSLSKTYANELRKKRDLLKKETKTKKNIFITLITTYGLIKNEHSIGLIDQTITLNQFFE